MKLIALKNHYGTDNGARRLILKGESFETLDLHGKHLIARRIAKEPGTIQPGPSSFQTIEPENRQVKLPEDTRPYEEYSYQELKNEAKRRQVEGFGSMKKVDLIQILQEVK